MYSDQYSGAFFMGIIFKKPVMILRKQFTELRIQRIMTGAGCFIEVNGIVIFDCLMGESLVQYCIDVFLKITYSAVLKVRRGFIPIL